jgi:D-erythronate 2-dehydrogenase
MKVVITGGGGYLGSLLVKALLDKGELTDRSGRLSEITDVVVLGRSVSGESMLPKPVGAATVNLVRGSVSDEACLRNVIRGDSVSVFHLAALLPGVTERDLASALEVNVDGTRNVLSVLSECCEGAKLVVTSSATVFSRAHSDVPITEETAVRPATIYGITKAIGEQLISAYGMAGKVDGRCARLSTVVIRPKKVGISAGASVSDVLRDVSLGRDCDLLLDPSTRVAVIDYQSSIEGLIRLHELGRDAFGRNPVINFPALTASVAEMLDVAMAAARRHGRVPGKSHYTPNAFVQKTIDAWPTSINGERAAQLGFSAKADLAEICDEFLADYDAFWRDRVTN